MPKSVFSEGYSAFLGLLIAARRKQGVTQAELASRIDKKQKFVSAVETGQRRIDIIEFIVWARALKMDPADLFNAVLKVTPKKTEI